MLPYNWHGLHLANVAMAFTNEIVSEEEIQLYGLDELKKAFDPWEWRNGRPVGYVHNWTVDRERRIYFMFVKMIEENGASGRPEPTSKFACVLNFDGERIDVLVDRVYCPSSYSENPFRMVWNLLEIGELHKLGMSRHDVIAVLKAALISYGYRGASGRQVANCVVEFGF